MPISVYVDSTDACVNVIHDFCLHLRILHEKILNFVLNYKIFQKLIFMDGGDINANVKLQIIPWFFLSIIHNKETNIIEKKKFLE